MMNTRKGRALTAALLIAASSVVAVGCGCDDIAPDCYTVALNFEPELVPAGGTMEITSADGEVFDCNVSVYTVCNTYEPKIWIYEVRPETLQIRIFDQNGLETSYHEVNPRYNRKTYQNACGGGCTGVAEVTIRPES